MIIKLIMSATQTKFSKGYKLAFMEKSSKLQTKKGLRKQSLFLGSRKRRSKLLNLRTFMLSQWKISKGEFANTKMKFRKQGQLRMMINLPNSMKQIKINTGMLITVVEATEAVVMDQMEDTVDKEVTVITAVAKMMALNKLLGVRSRQRATSTFTRVQWSSQSWRFPKRS